MSVRPACGYDAMAQERKFTRKQRRHLVIAFLATTIATACILFGGQ
jgi:hypothetical protein